MTASHLETILLYLIRANELPEPESEYTFCPGRKWRADYAYPAQKVLIEVEGGTWSNGRHTRGAGYAKDCEKYNRAAIMGWRLLRFTSSMIEDGTAIETIREAFG